MSEYEQSTRGPVVTPARVIAAVCVVAPFVAVLWVPIYDKAKPELGGFPFFFWWQLLWVAITAALMGLAYYVVRREEVCRKAAAGLGNVTAGDAADSADPAPGATEAHAAEEGPAEGTGTDEEGDAE